MEVNFMNFRNPHQNAVESFLIKHFSNDTWELIYPGGHVTATGSSHPMRDCTWLTWIPCQSMTRPWMLARFYGGIIHLS